MSELLDIEQTRVTCAACGIYADAATINLQAARRRPLLVPILSHIHHHGAPWTSGHHDDPPLCPACRLARNCHCHTCSAEREEQRHPDAGTWRTRCALTPPATTHPQS